MLSGPPCNFAAIVKVILLYFSCHTVHIGSARLIKIRKVSGNKLILAFKVYYLAHEYE